MVMVLYPGALLLARLKQKKITQKALADALGLPPSHINEVIKGKRRLMPAMALGLERFGLGSANKWLYRQADWEIHLLVTFPSE
jgi:addiction module HigA family antidote